jgi:dihydroneopterin aldolase
VVAQSLYFYSMMFIHLHDVLFHSKHGLYDDEKENGGEFLLNLSAAFNTQRVTSLSDTVDYVTVYELVKQRMHQPTPLLETIVIEIAQQILAQFSSVEEVHISLKKIHPPIEAFNGSVGVSYNLKRENLQ